MAAGCQANTNRIPGSLLLRAGSEMSHALASDSFSWSAKFVALTAILLSLSELQRSTLLLSDSLTRVNCKFFRIPPRSYACCAQQTQRPRADRTSVRLMLALSERADASRVPYCNEASPRNSATPGSSMAKPQTFLRFDRLSEMTTRCWRRAIIQVLAPIDRPC